MLTNTVSEFYENQTVFITGATGLLGKSVIEKLLRSCRNVRCIYVLIRPKRGKLAEERLQKLLESELFDLVRQDDPSQLNKIKPLEGDVSEENFGMSQENLEKICNDVSIVIHAAATVRFNEPMKIAVGMNLIPVIKLMEFAQKIKNLKILIHVSTAYANCDEEVIQECIYPPPIDPYKLLEVTDCLSEDMLAAITPKLIGSKPNTYTFTKQLAEYVISQNMHKLPIVIVRPSIIGSSVAEPFPGWIDNFNAATGLIAAISKGMLRSMMGDYEKSANIIPVDTTANFIIAVGWYSAGTYKRPLTNGNVIMDVDGKLTKSNSETSLDESRPQENGQIHNDSRISGVGGSSNESTDKSMSQLVRTHASSTNNYLPATDNGLADYIPVYNCTLDNDKLTWGTFVQSLLPRIQHSPSVSCQALPNFHLTTNAWYYDLKWTFSHMIPAAALDLLRLLQGQQPTYLKNMDRLKDVVVRLSYFTLNHWHFVNDNKMRVVRAMTDQDRKNFNLELNNVDWVSYLNVYHHGTKVYALKEKSNTNRKSMSNGRRLRLLYFGFRYLSMFIVLFYMMGRMHAFHGMFYQMLRTLFNIARLLRV